MPSLVEQYSHPEDIAAYRKMTRLYKDYIDPPLPPLREHGPEQDDRWCLKHYQEPSWRSSIFYVRGRCRPCEDEQHQAWVEEVRCKFQRGLAAAARGEKVKW